MSGEAARVFIVGNPGIEHVGSHFFRAAVRMGIEARLIDHGRSWGTSRWWNRLSYHFLGKRPTRLRAFDAELAAAVREFRSRVVIVTGISAPDAATVRAIRESGVVVVNYLTDDPWNPANGARFFWPAVVEYDVVYSPRRANMEDLRRLGCRRVEYLQFAYNPELHFPALLPEARAGHERYAADVTIVGGADEERIALARRIAGEGLSLRLFGGYWDRCPDLRRHYGGFVHGPELRMAVSGATVNLCMGRRANRDGHAMRSLELPAMGACMVVEDTEEHRELFGDDGECVEYYGDTAQLVRKVRRLCGDKASARRLGDAVLTRIRDSGNTYADRLQRILQDVKGLR